MPRPQHQQRRGIERVAKLIVLLSLASLTIGSGTCVIVEEGPYESMEGPGENEERMQEQEIEVMEESNR